VSARQATVNTASVEKSGITIPIDVETDIYRRLPSPSREAFLEVGWHSSIFCGDFNSGHQALRPPLPRADLLVLLTQLAIMRTSVFHRSALLS
jgi:hypothetical protein